MLSMTGIIPSSIVSKIIGDLIQLSQQRLERNYIVLKVLKKMKLTDLKPDFESIYTHALVKYGANKQPIELIYLFSLEIVQQAFKDELYAKMQNEFRNTLNAAIDTNPAQIQGLKYLNFSLDNEISEFLAIYEELREQTKTPKELELFNRIRKLELQNLELLEHTKQKSFEHQTRKYLKRLESDFYKTYIAENKYVDLIGETYEKNNTQLSKQTYDPIDAFLTEWLINDNQNFLAILGEYGTGKTTLCRYIAYKLSSQNDSKLGDPKKRIPFLFYLRNFRGENLEDYILSALNRNGIEDINAENFLSKIDNGEIILIFDGFDEMAQNIETDEKRRNFRKIEALIERSSKSKILLTCREEYFKSEEEQKDIFKDIDKKNNYQMLFLPTFNDMQILKFLQSHTEDPQYYWEKINEIFDIYDLAKRPVLLELITRYLPSILKNKTISEEIKASDLYERCIDDELDRKGSELTFKISKIRRKELLQNLAVWLFLNDSLHIEVDSVIEELNLSEFFDERQTWKLEKYLNEFLTFSFLIKEADNIFRISHKSFRDYLVALAFRLEIYNHSIKHFGKKQITTEISFFISELNPSKNYLLELIKQSTRTQEGFEWCGTNAAKIILLHDPAIFKGEDLTGCELSYVDFQNSDLSDCIMKNANLKYCNFTNSPFA